MLPSPKPRSWGIRANPCTYHYPGLKRHVPDQAQKLEARLEDLQVWEQRKVKEAKAGPKAYTYYLASWREGGKLRNVYLGSSQRMSREEAHEKARALKRKALGLSSRTPPANGNSSMTLYYKFLKMP
jgi:hypothetical protein